MPLGPESQGVWIFLKDAKPTDWKVHGVQSALCSPGPLLVALSLSPSIVASIQRRAGHAGSVRQWLVKGGQMAGFTVDSL